MCRFIAYIGEPIVIENLIAKPRHSLVRQSLAAQQAHAATQGDGFGLGWYGERREPALYREVMPAWSDENLLSLAGAVRSDLFFAHVRAATGGGIQRSNCHPFRCGRWMFMHNGRIGGYAALRRRLEAMLPDALYAQRRGATDSELLFLLVMARIEAGEAPAEAVLGVLDHVQALARADGSIEPLRFTAALTDGTRIHAFRLASDGLPPTLYRSAMGSGVVLASEPLSDDRKAWEAIPAGTALAIERPLGRRRERRSPALWPAPA